MDFTNYKLFMKMYRERFESTPAENAKIPERNENIWNNRRKEIGWQRAGRFSVFESLDFTPGGAFDYNGKKDQGELTGGIRKGRMEESME